MYLGGQGPIFTSPADPVHPINETLSVVIGKELSNMVQIDSRITGLSVSSLRPLIQIFARLEQFSRSSSLRFTS